MPQPKKRVSSTGVTLAGDLPSSRAMVAFLAPYAQGVWHWFGLQATLSVLSILAGLATPALAAVAIDQAVAGQMGWGFLGLAGAMVAAALIGTASGPVAARFGVPLGGRLTRRTVAHALDIGLPGRRPFDDGDLLNRAGPWPPNAWVRVDPAAGWLLRLPSWPRPVVPKPGLQRAHPTRTRRRCRRRAGDRRAG